jgi:hypothetical protein
MTTRPRITDVAFVRGAEIIAKLPGDGRQGSPCLSAVSGDGRSLVLCPQTDRLRPDPAIHGRLVIPDSPLLIKARG